MEWTDQAVVLSTRRHGESSVIAHLLTREHGRHPGLIKGGSSKSARGSLQAGNRLRITWRARLNEQLGQITWDLEESSGTRWLGDSLRLAAVSAACSLCDAALAERDPVPQIYDSLIALLGGLSDDSAASLYVFWELGLLASLGFALDLDHCAAGGDDTDLAYVSPRSGRAVSRSAGQPYHDRLLPLPNFLLSRKAGTPLEIRQGLALTGYFLDRMILAPHRRSLPLARERLTDQA